LFSDEELILDEILSLKPDAMTPLEALRAIDRWKRALSEEKEGPYGESSGNKKL
jgi:DNA mismatch repair protein MutS